MTGRIYENGEWRETIFSWRAFQYESLMNAVFYLEPFIAPFHG